MQENQVNLASSWFLEALRQSSERNLHQCNAANSSNNTWSKALMPFSKTWGITKFYFWLHIYWCLFTSVERDKYKRLQAVRIYIRMMTSFKMPQSLLINYFLLIFSAELFAMDFLICFCKCFTQDVTMNHSIKSWYSPKYSVVSFR